MDVFGWESLFAGIGEDTYLMVLILFDGTVNAATWLNTKASEARIWLNFMFLGISSL